MSLKMKDLALNIGAANVTLWFVRRCGRLTNLFITAVENRLLVQYRGLSTLSDWRTNRKTGEHYRNPPVGSLGHERYSCALCGEGIVQGTEYSIGPHDERNIPTGPQISPVCTPCFAKQRHVPSGVREFLVACPFCRRHYPNYQIIDHIHDEHSRPTSGKGFYGY